MAGKSAIEKMAGADQENLGGRSAYLSPLWWGNEDYSFAGRQQNHRKDT